jgi:stage II sporulation protein AA (anti-sigma F factor antagonist)
MPLNQWSDDILIAEMGDEPAFSDDVAALMQRLEQPGDAMPHVVIDLKSVTFLNSSNIAQLLRLRRKVASGRRRLRICSVSDRVWSVMLITGLDKLFDFTDDVATSLASLQIGPK